MREPGEEVMVHRQGRAEGLAPSGDVQLHQSRGAGANHVEGWMQPPLRGWGTRAGLHSPPCGSRLVPVELLALHSSSLLPTAVFSHP